VKLGGGGLIRFRADEGWQESLNPQTDLRKKERDPREGRKRGRHSHHPRQRVKKKKIKEHQHPTQIGQVSEETYSPEKGGVTQEKRMLALLNATARKKDTVR